MHRTFLLLLANPRHDIRILISPKLLPCCRRFRCRGSVLLILVERKVSSANNIIDLNRCLSFNGCHQTISQMRLNDAVRPNIFLNKFILSWRTSFVWLQWAALRRSAITRSTTASPSFYGASRRTIASMKRSRTVTTFMISVVYDRKTTVLRLEKETSTTLPRTGLHRLQLQGTCNGASSMRTLQSTRDFQWESAAVYFECYSASSWARTYRTRASEGTWTRSLPKWNDAQHQLLLSKAN